MRKKALAVAMSAAMVCSVAGCTKEEVKETTTVATAEATTAEATTADKSADKEETTAVEDNKADSDESTKEDKNETPTEKDTEATTEADKKEIEILDDAKSFADAMKDIITSDSREVKLVMDINQSETFDGETTENKVKLELSGVTDGDGNAQLTVSMKVDTDDANASYAGIISDLSLGVLVVDSKVYLDASSLANTYLSAMNAASDGAADQLASMLGTTVDELLENVQVCIPLGDIDLSKYQASKFEKLYDIYFDDLAAILSVDGLVTEKDGDFVISIDTKKAAEMTDNIKAVLPDDLDNIYDTMYDIVKDMDLAGDIQTIVKAISDDVIKGIENVDSDSVSKDEIDGMKSQLEEMIDELGSQLKTSIDEMKDEKADAIEEIKSEIEDLNVNEEKDAVVEATIKKITDGYSFTTEFDETEEDEEYDITSNTKGSITLEIKTFDGSIKAPKGYVNLSNFVTYAFNIYSKYVELSAGGGDIDGGNTGNVDLEAALGIELKDNQRILSYDEATKAAVITAVEGYEFYGSGYNYHTLMSDASSDYFNVSDYGTLFDADAVVSYYDAKEVKDNVYSSSSDTDVTVFYFAENGSLYVVSYSSYEEGADVTSFNGEDTVDFLVDYAESFELYEIKK